MANKKDFNAAEMFLSTAAQGAAGQSQQPPAEVKPMKPAKPESTKATAPTSVYEFKAAQDPEESRSQRVNLLMKPSTYAKLKTIAYCNNTSVNHFIEKLVNAFIDSHKINNE